MKIKVCGLTNIEQVKALEKMNVDYAGFIFYPKSPRYVLQHLTQSDIKNIVGNIKKVGVFVNEKIDDLLSIVDQSGLDMVQLHGDESPEYCQLVRAKIKTIKAFQVNDMKEFLENIRLYYSAVDYFLLDTPTKEYGGSGKKFDWHLIADVHLDKPFFLSGGISAGDHLHLTEFDSFAIAKDFEAIDINSRFEIQPGIKNLSVIKDFLIKIRS